ncbi:MAG TPA: 4-alpha-glucanotransferase [Thermomicrobiales bacterium]|jgi:4-alpha-glucanotransferase|nr:4-alpha-glucanotransferase [Thermomicrobiales bacterium]
MSSDRVSGVLLHPTSFPGPHGIGDLGPAAFRFVDWLTVAKQRRWQVMPLGPTGYGDSPYASPSAFAGNPLLVSLEWLGGELLLTPEDFGEVPHFDAGQVNFGAVYGFKMPLLERAFDRFNATANDEMRTAFDAFCTEEDAWLDDYAIFQAVKRANDHAAWWQWPEDLKLHRPAALEAAREEHADRIAFEKWVQYIFRRQWTGLKRYANDRDIQIIGDIPIFVAMDSADVWGNQSVFRLDEQGNPQVIAGVPPDYFSPTGQLWGNPHYDWATLRETGYQWWIDRVKAILAQVDIVRVDHFRGFAAAWAVPYGSDTAEPGRWEEAPGRELFLAIRAALGDVPFIAEDLGIITEDVDALRLGLGIPGMKVLQFGYDAGAKNVYLPHNFERETVVYSATHDNQTTIGWFNSITDEQRATVQRYLGLDGSDIAWDFIRQGLASVANVAIFPLQDIMRLGDEARMNTPGRLGGNWTWRYRDDQLARETAEGLGELATTYGRVPASTAPPEYDPFDYSAPDTKHHLHRFER